MVEGLRERAEEAEGRGGGTETHLRCQSHQERKEEREYLRDLRRGKRRRPVARATPLSLSPAHRGVDSLSLLAWRAVPQTRREVLQRVAGLSPRILWGAPPVYVCFRSPSQTVMVDNGRLDVATRLALFFPVNPPYP
eukprot:scaffold151683_cov22-Tisochrysis_lutea.AAC.1